MIRFENVSKTYLNGTQALKEINLHVKKGEFVFVVGASGSGKSTFLKLITREEKPSKGKVIIAGEDVTRISDKKVPFLRRKMGIVFQDFRLIKNMNVFDNVAFAMRVTGASEKEIKNRVPYILALVGLSKKEKSMPDQLSGGEQQRVGLSRALVNNPKLIIADAVSITDIEQIILACKKSEYEFLPSGTTATAQVLGNFWLPQTENQLITKYIPELPKLILSGTGTKTTITQLEVLEASDDYENTYFVELDINTVLSGVNNELTDRILNNLKDNNVVVINASKLVNEFDGFSDDSLNTDMTKVKLLEHVSVFLADLTRIVTEQRDAILIILGGETSYKCCNAINANQLQIIDEIIPSVALTLDHKAQWIVSKSGHIGNSNSLIEILKYFDLHAKIL